MCYTDNMEVLHKQHDKSQLNKIRTKDWNQSIKIIIEKTTWGLSRLKEICSEFDNMQWQIIAIQGNKESQGDEIEDEEFEDRYLRLKIQLKKMARNMPKNAKQSACITEWRHAYARIAATNWSHTAAQKIARVAQITSQKWGCPLSNFLHGRTEE